MKTVAILLLCGLSIPGMTQTNLEPPEVVSIRFLGNSNIEDNRLAGELNLQEKSILRPGTLYNVHHVRREMENLQNFYQQYGFLDALVRDSVVTYNDREVGIIFLIQEGRRYFLQSVQILGNLVIPDEVYLSNLGLQKGAAFNVFEIREQLRQVLRRYEETGYPLVMIADSAAVGDSVALFIQVREGPRLEIGRIEIPEIAEIKGKVIRRELIVQPGEIFNIARIEESKRRLFETSLFSSVNITTSSIDTSAGTIDLKVDLLPSRFRAFDIDFGAEQTRGFENADPVVSIGASGSWYHNNLGRGGRRIKIQTQLNSIYPDIFIPQLFNVDFFYVEPWILGLRLPFTVNPFYKYYAEASSSFLSLAGGVRLGTSYRWFRRIRLQSFLEWSQVKFAGESDIDLPGFQEQRIFETQFIWDERDNYFDPHHGFRFNLNPRMVGYVLGGETDYWQVESSISTYLGLGEKLVIAQNLNIAFAGVPDSNTVIPSISRFYLGGNNSVRGYPFQGIGPQGGENGTTPIGGNIRFFANLELRFPLYRALGGELFYDLGGLWKSLETVDRSGIHSATGFGITVETPIGPARVDFGFPITERKPSSKAEIHIAITHAF